MQYISKGRTVWGRTGIEQAPYQKNNLLKSSESNYIHVRPHTSDSSNKEIPYYNHTNGKISISWQSFWFNKSFVKKIIIK